MSHKFPSVADALAAGYVRAGHRHGFYRGCKIYDRDTSNESNSGPGMWVGYSYAITVSVPDEIDDYTFNYDAQDFGGTVSVWTDDLNQLRRPGSFCVMYAPDDLAAAIKQARAWIDAYYVANPASVARLEQIEAERVAVDARHAAKVIGRQVRRAARMAAATL